MIDKKISVKLLFVITSPKKAEKAKSVFKKKNLPIQYMLYAKGTATSEIMDTLGLGSIDKSILVSVVSQNAVDDIFQRLQKELKIGSVNSGIAFTIPITGANHLILHMIEQTNDEYSQQQDRKEDTQMGAKYAMIAAVVNRGYSEEVMEAAKSVGASGGTVVNTRSIADEEVNSTWGLGVQEEKEVVLIVSDSGSKADVMKKISECCGMHSEAKGMVMSVPIDSVLGLQKKD